MLNNKEMEALAESLVKTVTNRDFMNEPPNMPRFYNDKENRDSNFFTNNLALGKVRAPRLVKELEKEKYQQIFQTFRNDNPELKNYLPTGYTKEMEDAYYWDNFIDSQYKYFPTLIRINKKFHKDGILCSKQTKVEQNAKAAVNNKIGACGELCDIIYTLLCLVKIPNSTGTNISSFLFDNHVFLIIHPHTILLPKRLDLKNIQLIKGFIVDPWIEYWKHCNMLGLWKIQQNLHYATDFYQGYAKKIYCANIGKMQLSNRHLNNPEKLKKHQNKFASLIQYFDKYYKFILSKQWPLCKIVNCYSHSYKHGLCGKHYAEIALYGWDSIPFHTRSIS